MGEGSKVARGRSDHFLEDTIPEEVEALSRELASPVPSLLELPAAGLYGYGQAARRFGTRGTVEAIHRVGEIWASRYANSPIGIGDISKKGGGKLPPHASHTKGVDLDVRPQRKDGMQAPVTISDGAYSRAMTQELIDLFYANGIARVRSVFFNDAAVDGVAHASGHHNHFHVRLFDTAEIDGPPVNSLGNNSPSVREIQRRLNYWISGGGPSIDLLTEEGSFGQRTHEAVIAFQSAKGLTADGVVRPDTWAALPTKSG